MALEIESKLLVPDLITAEKIKADPKIKAYMQESWRGQDMSASYYDTPAHTLTRLHWALRLRRAGEESVATLKTPYEGECLGLAARNEWECPAADVREAIPRLVAQGAPEALVQMTEGQELIERCCIAYTRLSGVLELPGEAVAVISLDNGLLMAEDKREPFIELEIELLFGDPAEVRTLSGQLSKDYGLTPVLASKYERALRLIRSRKRSTR